MDTFQGDPQAGLMHQTELFQQQNFLKSLLDYLSGNNLGDLKPINRTPYSRLPIIREIYEKVYGGNLGTPANINPNTGGSVLQDRIKVPSQWFDRPETPLNSPIKQRRYRGTNNAL